MAYGYDNDSRLRSMARAALWLVLGTLLTGKQIWATFFSAVAIIILKMGVWGYDGDKNMKWMILSGISFLASLGSWSFEQGYDMIDEEKAYGLKMSLLLGFKSMQVWGIILALFLVSAAIGDPF